MGTGWRGCLETGGLRLRHEHVGEGVVEGGGGGEVGVSPAEGRGGDLGWRVEQEG